MFSAVDAVLIRPLPYIDAGRLVMIWDEMSHDRFPETLFDARRMAGVAAQQHGFHGYRGTEPADVTLSGEASPNKCRAAKSPRICGPSLACGRCSDAYSPKTKTCEARAWPSSAMALWQRRFGASREVLGRKIISERQSVRSGRRDAARVLLHAGARYRHLDAGLIFRQLLANFSWHDAHCVARLKPGVTLSRPGNRWRH